MSSLALPRVRQLTASRDGKPAGWSEDASRADMRERDDGWSAFLAVSDGAGSTAFPGEWARVLVDAAAPRWINGDVHDGVAAVRQAFDPLDAETGDDDFLLEDLWYERGAAATLLLAHVTHASGRTRCRVLAVGDSVAIVSREDALTSFPIEASKDFSNRTEAVKTRAAAFETRSWSGELPPASMLVVATDGIGRWILDEAERNGPASAYAVLRRMSTRDLPDVEDDVTLVILDLPPARPGLVDRLLDLLRR